MVCFGVVCVELECTDDSIVPRGVCAVTRCQTKDKEKNATVLYFCDVVDCYHYYASIILDLNEKVAIDYCKDLQI